MVGPVVVLELACRAFIADAVNDTKELPLVVLVDEFRAVVELEEKLRVVVEAPPTFGIEFGTSTGQKDQTRLPWSQYKSISNRRKPEARRFEKQSAESSSSYRRVGKQAAVKDTPGVVI